MQRLFDFPIFNVSPASVPGYASIAAALFFLSGIQLLCIGFLGEYISRIFLEVKARPSYLIKELVGLDPK